MTYQTLDLSIDRRGIAYLNLARPQQHNAMNATMLGELAHCAADLEQNPAVRAVVLGGRGASFCAGADLGWMRDNLDRPRAQRLTESAKLTEVLRRLAALSKLLIAKVGGSAYAGGIGLIAVCDIAIGVPEARFCLTETKLGLAPANIASHVIARMGWQNSRRCMLNAHFFDADEAVALGLLDKLSRPEHLDAAVEKEITELLNCAPGAVAASKKLLHQLPAMDESAAATHTAVLLADLWQHPEAQAGITAFFAKQKPPWAP